MEDYHYPHQRKDAEGANCPGITQQVGSIKVQCFCGEKIFIRHAGSNQFTAHVHKDYDTDLICELGYIEKARLFEVSGNVKILVT
jgi:hypothetical protein